ncbi:hypothetical protein [Actinomyces vulturis]|uniref:hypothetical protein n=1 Tax=Actinomyces vulturis TaxID=1857645 RepID=UPI0008344E50|nr:hypothetical protein [Actinomyces vulturis]
MNKAIVTACACSLVLLAGCAPSSNKATPALSLPSAPVITSPTPTPESTEVRGTVSDIEDGTELADPGIMASMECETDTLPEWTYEDISVYFGEPNKYVVVETGTGINPYETWWIVLLGYHTDDAAPEEQHAFLTNSIVSHSHKTWIALEDNHPWDSVNWNEEQLIRGHSALAKARECYQNE